MAVRKAQISMEFIYTYGFAIAVSAIALGVLGYMIFNDSFVSDACYVGEGLSCKNYAFNGNTLRLELANNIGKTIGGTFVECTYMGTPSGPPSMGGPVLSGNSFEATCDFASLPSNKKVKILFTVYFTEQDKSFTSSADGYAVLTHR